MTGPACGGQQVVFASSQRYRRFNQLGETTQRVVGTTGTLNRRRQILGDALIQRGPDQVGLCRKPAVERSLTHTRMACDRFHRGVGPQLAIDSRAARRMRSTLRAASARNGRSSTAVIVTA